ncbi:hypothetical protein GCK32_002164 [Trichostrongylus colubriformis]|uniref:Uncharacterized protein n=1 Tax=Trichostrongylus colubriformis TaxID=6319 RepID=A0AAN8F3G6_TRICO
MRTVVILVLFRLIKAEFCEKRERRDVKWYFDEEESTCFAYPVNCYTPIKVTAELHSSEEQCTLKHMSLTWKTYTLSCPFSLPLAVFTRSNGDQVPYIFSPALCRRNGDKMTSDICSSSEFCYTHRHFAFCCNNRAFVGQGPVSGKFTLSGIGGPKKHLAATVFTPPPPRAPTDCNTQGDRHSIEWYVRGEMGCVARRSDCDSPGFPVESVNTTYPTLQQCMDARFGTWMISYRLTCTKGYSPVSVDGSPLVFSKTLCGSLHHSDVCNRDEYCGFSNRSAFAFCCRRSDKSSVQTYVIHGNLYNKRQRHQRHRKRAKFVHL